MKPTEKYIAKVLFKLKVHENDGQSFENLFSNIMIRHNENFRKVKPYGNIGDRKNDGFDKTKGIYYQVFAPENIEKTRTVSDAVKKLNDDFEGLKEYWDDVCKIQEFYYVVYEKFKGLPPTVEKEIIVLGNSNPGVICDTFPANSLEVIFLSLGEEDIIDIVGILPNDEISFIDYHFLNEAIDFLMNSESDFSPDAYVEDPDFEKKIIFNNLGSTCKNMLNVASYQIGDLEAYFMENGDYVKEELKKRFRLLYNQSKDMITEEMENYADQRFFYILKNASPNGKKAVKDAVLVLMAFYFESCDIFEIPEDEEVEV